MFPYAPLSLPDRQESEFAQRCVPFPPIFSQEPIRVSPDYTGACLSSDYAIKIEDSYPKDVSPSYMNLMCPSAYGKEFYSFSRDGHTYYALSHNTEYKVRLCNNTNNRVNATLKIDGTNMGIWRLKPYSNIVVERPIHNSRKFTFVKESSWQASMGGISAGEFNNGLVEVTFVPEIQSTVYYASDSLDGREIMYNSTTRYATPLMNASPSMNIHAQQRSFASCSPSECTRAPMSNLECSRGMSYSSGGTVLGGDSSQKFLTASHMIEDHSKKVTKRVRLVVDERKPFVSLKTFGNMGIIDDAMPPRI